MLSEDKVQARKLYRKYISDGAEAKKEDIYNTVSQRILGTEKFVETVMERIEERFEKRRRRHEFSLEEIAETIGQMRGITLKQLREKSKERHILSSRKLVSLIAKEYDYKGREIAAYLRKDPSLITRYLKEAKNLKPEMENVMKILSNKTNLQ